MHYRIPFSQLQHTIYTQGGRALKSPLHAAHRFARHVHRRHRPHVRIRPTYTVSGELIGYDAVDAAHQNLGSIRVGEDSIEVSGLFDSITEAARRSANFAPAPAQTTPRIFPTIPGFGSQIAPPRPTASYIPSNQFSAALRANLGRPTPTGHQMGRAVANHALRFHAPHVRVFPMFGVGGEFEGYVARDGVSGEEIGCCLVGCDTVAVNGFFDFVGDAAKSVAKVVTAPITAPIKASIAVTKTVGKGIVKVADSAGKALGDVATSAFDRVVKPVGKFVVKNIGIIGAGALAVVCPPAGAVAIAALAIQALAIIARETGLAKGTFGTIVDIADTAAAVASGGGAIAKGAVIAVQNVDKLAGAASAAAGAIGKATGSSALRDISTGLGAVSDVGKGIKGDVSAIARLAGTAGQLTGVKEIQTAGQLVSQAGSFASQAGRTAPNLSSIANLASSAGQLAGTAGQLTGVQALKDVSRVTAQAGNLAAQAQGAARGNVQSIGNLLNSAGKVTGKKFLADIASTVNTAGKAVQNGRVAPGKMATEALRLASPQAYEQLIKLDPSGKLLTNEGIHKLAELGKNSLNPAAAARVVNTVQARYTVDLTSSMNDLVKNAKSPDKAIREAAAKVIDGTRKLAATGNADAKRALELIDNVNNLQKAKSTIQNTIPAIPKMAAAAASGSATFIGTNGQIRRGKFIRDPRGIPGVLVDGGKRFQGVWKAV